MTRAHPTTRLYDVRTRQAVFAGSARLLSPKRTCRIVSSRLVDTHHQIDTSSKPLQAPEVPWWLQLNASTTTTTTTAANPRLAFFMLWSSQPAAVFLADDLSADDLSAALCPEAADNQTFAADLVTGFVWSVEARPTRHHLAEEVHKSQCTFGIGALPVCYRCPQQEGQVDRPQQPPQR